MNIDYCYRGLKEPAIYKERNNIMDTNNYTNQFNNPTTSSYSDMITEFIQGVDNEQNSQNNIWEYRGKKARKKGWKKEWKRAYKKQKKEIKRLEQENQQLWLISSFLYHALQNQNTGNDFTNNTKAKLPARFQSMIPIFSAALPLINTIIKKWPSKPSIKCLPPNVE